MANWMTRRQVRSQPVQSYTEKRLQKLLDAYDTAMGRLNDQYLRMMGEHIRDIGTMWPSDVHRLQQIRRMNKNLSRLTRRIAVAAERSEADIRRAFEDIAKEDIRMQQKILGVPDAVVSLAANIPLQRILKGQARETAGKMRNLSNTTVVSKYYRDAIDEAVTAVQSGVEDYNTAIRRVIREAGEHGLRVTEEGTRKVDYESGWSRRLDTAARMNVLDGVRHLNQSIMEEVSRQFGANGVEIDAHMLCAEDHLPYQGGQYSNEEFEEIQDSLDRPFGEWNCRHSWHGIILGVSPPTYTPEQLQQFESYSTERVEIDGITKTRYQWSQEMRRVETAIRRQKDTANLARATGDDKLRLRCQGTILQLNQKYEVLAKKAGLQPEFQRTYVAGFKDAKYTETLTSNANSGTMIVDGAPIRTLGATSPRNPSVINPETGLPLDYVIGRKPEYPPDHTMAGYGCKTGRQIDDIDRLVRIYNASPERWQKEKARYWVYDSYSEERQVELHWYQHPDVGKVEHKIKFGDNGEEYVDDW